jgi:hypothetical protein
MAITKAIPALISQQIIRTIENELVMKQIFTTDTKSEITKMGDKVSFVNVSDPTIAPYTQGTTSITYEDLTDANVDLTIDQANYYAFQVHDIDALQSQLELQNSQAARSAYGLANKADVYGLGLASGATGGTVTATVTSVNVLATVAEIKQKLEELNIKTGWLVLPPWMKKKLTLAGVKFQIGNGVNGKGTFAFTDELDLKCYISNNVAKATANNVTTYTTMASHMGAGVYAQQVLDSETIRLESVFATACRGLHVFGAKLIKPAEAVKVVLVEGAETDVPFVSLYGTQNVVQVGNTDPIEVTTTT